MKCSTLIRLLLLLVFAVIGYSAPASAQTPTLGHDKLGWDQPASDLATANGYQYAAKVDAAAPVALVNVACSGTASPFACKSDFPAAVPGQHSITLTAAITVNGETAISAPSTPFAFVLFTAPVSPANVHIEKGGQ